MNNVNRPQISVIIPVYNVENYIEKCMRSLYNQTLSSIEYIIIDDNSTDRSVSIIKYITNKFPNRKKQVKLLQNEKNEGVAKCRQIGIDNANGEYIIHCDADGWVEPDMYETMMKCAIKGNADIVSSGFFIETINGQQIIDNKNFLNLDYRYHLISNHWAVLWRHLIKSDIAKQIKFSDGINAGEDYIFRVLG